MTSHMKIDCKKLKDKTLTIMCSTLMLVFLSLFRTSHLRKRGIVISKSEEVAGLLKYRQISLFCGQFGSD